MPRIAAAEALRAVETEDAFSNIAIDIQIGRRKLSQRDAALATSITYGVLKNLGQLDAALHRWLKKPISNLEPFTRAVLRSGAFQLLFMDRVPKHAAVSEAVAILKRRKRHRAGLANAVLRRLSEHADELRASLQGQIGDAVSLSNRCGMPLPLSEALIDRLGLESAIAYGLAIQTPARLTLRLRAPADRDDALCALAAEGVVGEATLHAPGGIRVQRGGRASEISPVRVGCAVVQDEASQLVGLLASPQPNARVVDLCAGRGGKTFHLADLMDGVGGIVASDRSQKKLEELKAGAARLGITCVETRTQEALESESADLVLIDAPCSGLGVIRRHPELRWKHSSERTAALARTQRELLDIGARLVSPGGVLVYAVCSDQPAEGRRQVEWFLRANSGFKQEAPPDCLDWSELLSRDGDLLTQPHIHGTDAFFAARLRRG